MKGCASMYVMSVKISGRNTILSLCTMMFSTEGLGGGMGALLCKKDRDTPVIL